MMPDVGSVDRAAEVLAASPVLIRCVDGYHATAYSSGFTKDGLRVLRGAPGIRSSVKACCGDFSGVAEYFEEPGFDEGAELEDQTSAATR